MFECSAAHPASVFGGSVLAAKPRPRISQSQLQGFKYFSLILPRLEALRNVATERDRAGNRQLFCDQYVGLLLIYFFNSVVTSLRGLQQVTELEKVQELLGIRQVALGSLSEAAHVFDAEVLHGIIAELALRAVPLQTGREADALRGLTAVDGTILPALPRMVWALWKDDQHRGVKLHLHFDVLAGVPADATMTPAACSEPDQLAATLKPQRLYVVDRGYASFELFRKILDAGSSFVARVKDSTVFTVKEERPLSKEAEAAGVVRDVVIDKLGTAHHKDYLRQPVRLVVVQRTKPDGSVEELWLVTDKLDLDADLVALAYKYRWTVELFFRWFKRVLGCRHLLSTCPNGVTIQAYVALIASLLITLWTGRKPTKRTFEMLQYYLMGWASEEEMERHLQRLAAAEKKNN
jgi:Transposase DDE domain